MKVITVYELLGLVKEGKAPKKIKFKEEDYIQEYYFDKNIYVYDDEYYGKVALTDDVSIEMCLNDKVEIIEEEKEIKELTIIKNADNTTSLQGKDFNYTMKTVDIILANKINELVREVRKLKDLSKCQK